MNPFPKDLPVANPQWKLHVKAAYLSAPTTLTQDVITATTACTDLSMLNSIMKFFKNLAQVAFITTTCSDLKDSAKDITTNCNVFSDAVKAFSLGKGLKDIFENGAKENLEGVELHQRNLGIAGGVFTTVIAGSSIASRMDKFNLIDLTTISEALGITAVLPFSVFVSGVEIVNHIVSIAKNSINIHKTNKVAEKIQKKQEAFRAEQENIATFLQNHVTRTKAKQIAALAEIEALQNDVENSYVAAGNAQTKFNQVLTDMDGLEQSDKGTCEKLYTRILWSIDRANAHRKLFKKKKAHDKVFEKSTNLRTKFEARVIKYDVLKALQAQFNPGADLDAEAENRLNRLITDKQDKWDIQLENCTMQNVKDGLGIFISCLATVALVATIVFNFLPGIALVSGVVITMTTVWLTVSVLGLASAALKNFHKSLEAPKLDFTRYAAAAA